jgi:hypothetical protein
MSLLVVRFLRRSISGFKRKEIKASRAAKSYVGNARLSICKL